jgi:predicted AAA+ superfamily ATPase
MWNIDKISEIKSSGIAISKNTVYELISQLENIYMFLQLPKFQRFAYKGIFRNAKILR